MKRWQLIVAMLAGLLAGAFAWRAAPAPAMSVSQPSTSTIQGMSVCGSAAANHDIFTSNGSQWCGSQGINISGAGIVNQFLCASTTGNCGGVFNGFIMTDNGDTSGGIFFAGSNAARFTYNQDISGGFYLTKPLSFNGDSVISAAPRVYFGGTLPLSPATSILIADMVAPKAITFDNLRVWIPTTCTCTTGPSIGLVDVTTSTTFGTAIPSCGTSVPTAVTLTTPNAAAGDEVQLKVTNAESCATPPTVLSGGAMYHMQ